MYLLPLVALRRGECVHVLHWPSLGEARPLTDPTEVVQRFAGLGARGFHLVDVDRAANHDQNNDQALADVLDQTVLPVFVGGGVRSMTRIQELLDSGARRVLVGTMGVQHPDWLKEASLIFQDRLTVCLDTDGTNVLVKGRTERSPLALDVALQRIQDCRPQSIHVAYVGSNGKGVPLMKRLAAQMKVTLSYEGPIADAAELETLDRAGIKGVVLGAEIYDGRLPFQELAKKYREP